MLRRVLIGVTRRPPAIVSCPTPPKTLKNVPPGLLTTLFASETLLPPFCLLDYDLCDVAHAIRD